MWAWQRRDEAWDAEESQSLRLHAEGRQREESTAEHEADDKQGRQRKVPFAPGANEVVNGAVAPLQHHEEAPEESNVAHGTPGKQHQDVPEWLRVPKEVREESNVAPGTNDGAVAPGAADSAAHRRAWLEKEIRMAADAHAQLGTFDESEDDKPEWYKAWKQNHPSPTWPPTTEYFLEHLNKMTDEDIAILMEGEPDAKDVPLPKSSTLQLQYPLQQPDPSSSSTSRCGTDMGLAVEVD